MTATGVPPIACKRRRTVADGQRLTAQRYRPGLPRGSVAERCDRGSRRLRDIERATRRQIDAARTRDRAGAGQRQRAARDRGPTGIGVGPGERLGTTGDRKRSASAIVDTAVLDDACKRRRAIGPSAHSATPLFPANPAA